MKKFSDYVSEGVVDNDQLKKQFDSLYDILTLHNNMLQKTESKIYSLSEIKSNVKFLLGRVDEFRNKIK